MSLTLSAVEPALFRSTPEQLRAFRLAAGVCSVYFFAFCLTQGYVTAVLGNAYLAPLVPWAGSVPTVLHIALFVASGFAALGLLANRFPAVSAAIVALAAVWSIAFSYFGFHHYMVLTAVVMTGLAIALKEPNLSEGSLGVAMIRVATVVAYLSAGINKLSTDYLSGELQAALLQNNLGVRAWEWFGGPLPDDLLLMVGHATAVYSVGVELLVPVLLFTRFRDVAIVGGLLLHAGIMASAVGEGFNALIVATYLLWCNPMPEWLQGKRRPRTAAEWIGAVALLNLLAWFTFRLLMMVLKGAIAFLS